MPSLEIVRLQSGDIALARTLFALMADVFEEESRPQSDEYLAALLGNETLWVYAASVDGTVVGGLTAHILPMTRAETQEAFLYDLAVDPGHQRRGIATGLVNALRRDAQAAGIEAVFVAADNEDAHALSFYLANGGEPSPVTVFTFGPPRL